MKGERKPLHGIHHQELHETVAEQSDRLRHWTDQIMDEAFRRGDFANLPGKGKPLNLHDSDPLAGPEADAYKILKNAGFTPEWVELRKQIVAEINWLREHPEHPERPSRIVEVNSKIDRHNRQVPTGSLALPKVPRDFGR